jgi:phosphotransacetylase
MQRIERAFEGGERLKALVERAGRLRAIVTAVVHPVDALSIGGMAAAMKAGLISPIAIGPLRRMEEAAARAGVDLSGVALVEAPHSHAAAAEAVALAREGRASLIMKGALHTDELMAEVVHGERGLRTERRISHVYVLDVPSYHKLLFVTDAAVNIAPSLEEKRDIVQNAIELAIALGVETPKVAILSAVETVYPPLKSTVEAAALCKMADRGQIKGGLLEGPLAFDNAVSRDAANAKGLASPVAGDADILIVPDIESGNMLAKQLDYLAGAVAAGVVLGARVPIILTSRAEGAEARLAASAAARLFLENRPALGK